MTNDARAEIVVTLDMIAAGMQVLTRDSPGREPPTSTDEALVADIFKAMVRSRFADARACRMQQLIRAARAHAKHLRDNAMFDNDYGAHALEEEAQHWEQLAGTAEAELLSG